MQRISITNPQNIIDGTAKKYYFKLRNTGGPKGDKGEKGDTGATGAQGPQGDPCTVVVNSTATLEPGSNAYVTNTGSLSNAVLNFGIPKGDRGPQGAKGDKGDTGAQGETGPRGPQGERGTNATVYVGTTSTLAPGSQATVYNSGSDSNAVLNFGIPKGEKGDTGSQGPQGPTGPQGPAGQNFAPTIVAELPATGDSSKLYLTPKAHTTQTATGNPITATITDGAGSMESFQLDGDTYQQSYTGKNLFNKNNYSDQTGYYIGGNGIWRSGGVNDHYFVFNIEPNTTYTFSKNAQASTNRFRVGISSEAPTVGVAFPIWGGGDTTTEITLTTDSDSKYAYVYYSVTVNVQEAIQSLQIELGSTATSYEPYVGGQASPNPDFPEPIQTVTGTQTISINGTDYPLDLGNIELNGLGDDGNGNPLYKDRIFKDGSDWKIHRATVKAKLSAQIVWNTGSFEAQKRIYASDLLVFGTTVARPSDNVYKAPLVSDYFTNVAVWDILQGTADGIGISSSGYISIRDSSKATSADLLSVLANNDVTAIAGLSSSYTTDTTITDTALIAQLEAIRTASLQNGTNTITNTATGTNLAGDMEIGYYGYNPTNRYDKWLWLDLNNNYEQIGS